MEWGLGTSYSAEPPRVWTPYAAQGVREAGSLEVGSGWFSFLRCSHCLNKHTRITGMTTRAIIRSTITVARAIPTSLLNAAGTEKKVRSST